MAVNVPNVPGVPHVLFAAASAALTFLTRDALGIFFGAPRAPWGIYRGGVPVVAAETVLAFDYRQQWAIADFPIERGAFETYDKVQVPYETGFRFTTGGSDAQRQALLSSIAAIAGDYNLYDIVTPTAVYINANIARYDYRQTAQDGVGLLQVDVYTSEIRQTAGGQLSNTKSPVSAARANGGPVQPQAATSSQAAKAPLVVGANGMIAGGV